MAVEEQRAATIEDQIVTYVALIRRWWLIGFVTMLLVLVLGAIWVLLQPRVYASDAKLLIAQRSGENNVVGKPEERLELVQQRVLSRQNLLSWVEKYDLFTSAGPSSSRVALFRQGIRISPEIPAARGSAGPLAFIVSVEAPDAAIAKKLAIELVNAIVLEDKRSTVQSLTSARLRALRSELAQKEQLFSETHPQIKAIRGEISALEERARADVPDLAETRRDGLRDQDSVDGIEVIDPPSEPQYPVRPSRRRLFIFVVLLALASAVIAIFARERMAFVNRRLS